MKIPQQPEVKVVNHIADQLTSNPVSASSLVRTLYAPVAEEMERVESRLRQEMASSHALVDELLRYGCLLGGKRMRPALVLLAGQTVGSLSEAHVLLAAVMEMIHTATLVHDDVLDQATVRRRLATINARWDNEASVLLGDYLFSHAFYLSSTLESTWACQRIGRATNIVCAGELRQKSSRGNFLISEAEYLEIIDSKTAELCACSCHLGAAASGADAGTAARLEQYGRALGVAFQIADDLLDLEGTEEAVGKSLGTDFEQRLPTLPLIWALSQLTSGDRKKWSDRLADRAFPLHELAPLLQGFDALDYSRRRAEDFALLARRQLEGLPESPAVDSLRTITEFVVARPG